MKYLVPFWIINGFLISQFFYFFRNNRILGSNYFHAKIALDDLMGTAWKRFKNIHETLAYWIFVDVFWYLKLSGNRRLEICKAISGYRCGNQKIWPIITSNCAEPRRLWHVIRNEGLLMALIRVLGISRPENRRHCSNGRNKWSSLKYPLGDKNWPKSCCRREGWISSWKRYITQSPQAGASSAPLAAASRYRYAPQPWGCLPVAATTGVESRRVASPQLASQGGCPCEILALDLYFSHFLPLASVDLVNLSVKCIVAGNFRQPMCL